MLSTFIGKLSIMETFNISYMPGDLLLLETWIILPRYNIFAVLIDLSWSVTFYCHIAFTSIINDPVYDERFCSL